MTVAQNLAFPLRNRGMPAAHIRERVGRIAEMLDMSAQLNRRASGLAADAKQKISLGRGLVRSDVSAVLLDRKSVVWGTSVSVRVDLGGRRSIKKKKTRNSVIIDDLDNK